MKAPSLLLILSLLAAACGTRIIPADGTDTPPFITATLRPTSTPRPTSTLPPPTLTPTLAPVAGVTSTRVNVRDTPNMTSAIIGILNSDENVHIVGKDASGTWWQILYPGGSEGKGWVLGTYIRTQSIPEVPIVGIGASGSPTGRVVEKLNVRSGPGINYDTLGFLNPNDVVALTGKNESGTWLQIEYTAGPDGKGWVMAAYIQVSDTSGLPVLTGSGTPAAGAGTLTPMPVTPTATLAPAWPDGDSSAAPAANVTLSPSASRSFSYSSDLSAPDGDAEDWIAFTLETYPGQSAVICASLTCSGNAELSVELWQDGALLDNWGLLSCGDDDLPIRLTASQIYQFRLSVVANGNGLQYIHYTLTIRIP